MTSIAEAGRAAGGGALQGRLARAAFGAFFLVSLVSPTLLAPVPAMVDYPNHLARMFLLARDGAQNPYYETAWNIYPNLAMDMIVPYIAQLVGAEMATRAFLLLSQLLLLTGACAIEQVVKGRIELSPFAGGMFVYSMPFALGFLNFEFGLGLALWSFALMLRTTEWPWPFRLAIHSLFSAALFAAHLYAFGVYGASLGFYELWRFMALRRSRVETFGRLVLLAIPAVMLFMLMVIAGGRVGGEGLAWRFAIKPLWIFLVLNAYNVTLSATVVSALLCFILFSWRRGVIRLEGAGPFIAGGFAVLYVIIPNCLLDTSYADFRIIPAAALILPAFVSLSFPDRKWRLTAASLAFGVVIVNLALVLAVWIPYNGEYKTLIASFGRLEKGARVLVGHSGDAPDPPILNMREYPIYHAPTLAVHYADAFVPSLFTARGKQPVIAREAFRDLDIPYGRPAPALLLKAIVEGGKRVDAPAYIRNWNIDYDYLYVVGPAAPNPMPNLLEELCAGSRFVLYRIRK